MKSKAQVSIEFSIAFVCTILFLILTCNLFVWFNHCLVRRQVAYEESRVQAADGRDTGWWFWKKPGTPGKDDFYTPPRLNIFSSGGIQEDKYFKFLWFEIKR